MKTKQLLLLLLILGGTHSALQAQTDTSKLPADTIKPPAFQVKLSATYLTRLHYFGRTDSLRSSGFFPLAELWFKGKFYVNAAPVFVHNRSVEAEYAGLVATAGYQKVSKRWLTNVYALKPFYKEQSELVQSALQAQAGASLSYLNPVVSLTAGGDIKYSRQTDYGVTAGVDHLFKTRLKTVLLVADPSLYAYAGTQRFQRSYYKKTTTGLPLLPTSGQQELVSEAASRFCVLSYEASLPLLAIKGPWILALTPAYVLPQNVLAGEGTGPQTDKAAHLFYTTVTLKYTLSPFRR